MGVMGTTGFFQESPGVKSYVRLVGFILLIADLLIMLWHEFKHRGHMSDETYSDNYCYFQIVILSFVFFPKVMQKIVEAVMQIKLGTKSESTESTNIQKTVITKTPDANTNT